MVIFFLNFHMDFDDYCSNLRSIYMEMMQIFIFNQSVCGMKLTEASLRGTEL